MLPTLYYTEELHDHVRSMLRGVVYVLDTLGGWTYDNWDLYQVWNHLSETVAVVLWDVRREENYVTAS